MQGVSKATAVWPRVSAPVPAVATGTIGRRIMGGVRAPRGTDRKDRTGAQGTGEADNPGPAEGPLRKSRAYEPVWGSGDERAEEKGALITSVDLFRRLGMLIHNILKLLYFI